MDVYNIIKFPLTTEKSVRIMETENKITFIVSNKAKKGEIKEALEKVFKVKVLKVTTLFTPKGVKKAYIKLHPDTPAIDIATQLGLM